MEITPYVVEKTTEAILDGIMALVAMYFIFRKRPKK
jgi:hypothetical protein